MPWPSSASWSLSSMPWFFSSLRIAPMGVQVLISKSKPKCPERWSMTDALWDVGMPRRSFFVPTVALATRKRWLSQRPVENFLGEANSRGQWTWNAQTEQMPAVFDCPTARLSTTLPGSSRIFRLVPSLFRKVQSVRRDRSDSSTKIKVRVPTGFDSLF